MWTPYDGNLGTSLFIWGKFTIGNPMSSRLSWTLVLTSLPITFTCKFRKEVHTFFIILRGCSSSVFGGQTFQRFPPFIFKYRPVHMTEVTLKANNFIDICSIPSKFHMCMYDRMKNIYIQNQSSIHRSCVWKAVHNRTFWITLVRYRFIWFTPFQSFVCLYEWQQRTE